MQQNTINRIFKNTRNAFKIQHQYLKTCNIIHHHQISSFSSTQTQNILNDEEKEFLKENGYLWLREFVPKNVALNIKNRINYMLENFDPNTTHSIFKTHRTEKQHKDLYFLNSGIIHLFVIFCCYLFVF